MANTGQVHGVQIKGVIERRRADHLPLLGRKPLKSVTHGEYDAKPTVAFPAAERHNHRGLTGTKVYCLITRTRGCELLTGGCYAGAPS